MSDDDLMPFQNDPFVTALRAPAQEHELAGEDAALELFRSTGRAARRRRALKRASVGGASVVLGLALTGGVAAAYTTDALPDPVQDVVHSALDPLPIPAPPSAHVRHQRRLAAAIERHRERLASPAPRRPSAAPIPRPRRTPATAVVSPPRSSAHPQTTASASPTAAPAKPSLSAAVSRRVVAVHGQVLLSGRLTRGTEGVPGRVVYAAELVAGQSTWRRVASGQTGSDGSVALTIPPLTTNVRLRLVTAQGVVSAQRQVAVVPKLTTTGARSGGDRIVTVSADGGRP
ncbi:MAG: hypothetical protein QOK42_901, partial [Frankiaceae bacterium]|nr:hypothetical protein [Frankiaceae bacterium]